MSNIYLTVHRSTKTIGGNCIEISTSDGGRILLDIGRPLDAPREAKNLLPESLDKTGHLDGVLVSHPHLDHYGLLEEAPDHWPVYCGEAACKLIQITSGIIGEPLKCDFRHWQSGKPQEVGPFTITPFLTDHSAFDAYMLQIDVAGKRLFYSGDFRIHGRKAALVERLMQKPPEGIDVLLMEGTNLGSDKSCMTEAELEIDYLKLFKETQGRVFINWSAQNIDRTVTLYRACKQTGRTLVIDLYTAEVLETLDHPSIPKPGWPNLKVVITKSFSTMYKRKKGNGEFVSRMAQQGIAARELAKTPEKWVIMTRPALVKDYQLNNVVPNENDAWCWANWLGYLKDDTGSQLKNWFEGGGAKAQHIHTSGHASSSDLRAFAHSMKAKTMVPIHGLAWDDLPEGFPAITRLVDGEKLLIV